MDRRKILLVVAAIVAALGTLLVFLYVRGADDRAQQRYETVEVLRAVAPIEPGESIETAAQAGKLKLQPVPQTQLLTGYQTSIDGLSGTVALTRVYPGEQIIASRFGGSADIATSQLPIPEGKLAISVNLSDTARVAGFVQPGSEVAIFLNGVDPESQRPFTRQLLTRVQVLGVGSTTPVSTTTTTTDGEQTTEQLPRTLITLALDKKDAQKVMFASSTGELTFALLTKSSRLPQDGGVTAAQLFSD
jgi:pilus assembly protein CpaB